MSSHNIEDLKHWSEKLAFVNGYLKSTATLNSFRDIGMEYYVVELELINNDIQATLGRHLQYLDRDAEQWRISYTEVEDWKKFIETDAGPFFSNQFSEIWKRENKIDSLNSDNIIADFKAAWEKYSFKYQLTFFIYLLEHLLSFSERPQIFNVTVDNIGPHSFYALFATDVVMKLDETRILFLHMAASD